MYPRFSSSELSTPTERILGVRRVNGGLGAKRPWEYWPREDVDSMDNSLAKTVGRCVESKLLSDLFASDR